MLQLYRYSAVQLLQLYVYLGSRTRVAAAPLTHDSTRDDSSETRLTTGVLYGYVQLVSCRVHARETHDSWELGYTYSCTAPTSTAPWSDAPVT